MKDNYAAVLEEAQREFAQNTMDMAQGQRGKPPHFIRPFPDEYLPPYLGRAYRVIGPTYEVRSIRLKEASATTALIITLSNESLRQNLHKWLPFNQLWAVTVTIRLSKGAPCNPWLNFSGTRKNFSVNNA